MADKFVFLEVQLVDFHLDGLHVLDADFQFHCLLSSVLLLVVGGQRDLFLVLQGLKFAEAEVFV